MPFLFWLALVALLAGAWALARIVGRVGNGARPGIGDLWNVGFGLDDYALPEMRTPRLKGRPGGKERHGTAGEPGNATGDLIHRRTAL